MELIPEATLKLIHSSFAVSSACGSIPFVQEKKPFKGRYPVYHLSDGKGPHIQHYCLSLANLSFQIFGGTFSTLRMFKGMMNWRAVPILDLGFVIYQAFGFATGGIFSILLHKQKPEFLGFLNLISQSHSKEGEGKGRSSSHPDLFSILSLWLNRVVYLQSICNSFLFLGRRNSIQYFYSLLPPSFKNGLTLFLIAIYEFLIPMNSWNIVLFMYFVYSGYTHYMGISLGRWAKSPALGSAKNSIILRNYRRLQVVDNIYNRSCFGTHAAPLGLSVLLFLVCWMTFATIRIYSLSSFLQPSFLIFPLSMIAMSFLSVVINSEGKNIYENTLLLISHLRQRKNFKKTRILQSFRPLRAQVGSLYFLKKSSVLIFTNSAISITINLLLTF